MTLGEKIKYYREKQKMGQQDLAELSHISVSAIRKYESGLRVPKEAQLEKLAVALHISPSVLKDTSFKKFTDLLPYLYEIGVWGDIQFVGEKDADGHYQRDTLSVRFQNSDIMDFLGKWAEKKDEVNTIKSAASEISDETTRELMLSRADEIEKEVESTLVSERITKDIYWEFKIPDLYPTRELKNKTKKLETYADFLNVLISLCRSSIVFECNGIYEKIWDAKVILTFDAESLELKNLSLFGEDCFGRFLYYFESITKFGVPTESFAFQQGDRTYYRYIIKDRILASGIDIIKGFKDYIRQEHPDEDFYDREAFENKTKDAIGYYDIPIEVQP